MSSKNEKSENKEKVEEGVSSKKDEKKKKKDPDDDEDKEKRRDSVTGSPLDTSSSSNSSVDSDEVEVDASENRDLKNAVASVASTESRLTIDRNRTDGAIDEAMKMVPKSQVGQRDVSESVVELNDVDNKAERKNGLPKDTKKSRKRNRKQQKKSKRDNSYLNVGHVTNGMDLMHSTEKDTGKDAAVGYTASLANVDQRSGASIEREKEIKNIIDGMEESNVLHMNDISSKFAQQFTQWIRVFFDGLLNGDAEEFTKKFCHILRILKKSAVCERYEHMTKQQFEEHVMNGVVCAFFDKVENTSVLHHLAATRDSNLPCDMKNHGCCRLMRIILSTLPWKDRRALLSLQTKRTGKTALHIAAATGQLCQLQALMDFEASPDCLDHSRRAPIHYVVMRNDLDMVKLLLWYGADISLRERSATPAELARFSPLTMPVYNYLHTRVNALEQIYMQWIKKFVRGVWTPVRAVSDLHFLRLSKACDSRRDALRNLVTKNRKVCINIMETLKNSPNSKKCPLMLLFIVPTFYKDEDRIADASNPQIFCAKLQNVNGSIVKLLPVRPLLSNVTWSVAIRSALEKPHNGYFYVYKLPESIDVGTYTLHLTVELEELRFQAPHIALAMQAFACGPPDLEHYNELRGLATHSVSKSKMD